MHNAILQGLPYRINDCIRVQGAAWVDDPNDPDNLESLDEILKCLHALQNVAPPSVNSSIEKTIIVACIEAKMITVH